MADTASVIIARLQVWVKTVRDESIKINQQLEDLKKEMSTINKELVGTDHGHEMAIAEILANRKSCIEKFGAIEAALKAQQDLLPTDKEIEEHKSHKKEIQDIKNKIWWATGTIAGVVFILSVLKYIGKI